jgi:glycosyltransferase involved in cell wall biosynthesis
LISASEKFLVVSQHTKQDILEHYGIEESRIAVSYPGVLPQFFDSAHLSRPPELNRYFVFVGTFAPRKNLKTVIRALARVANQISEELLIIAYWDLTRGSEVVDLASRLGISGRVRFLSDLSVVQLAAVYKHATAAVLLSEYEGFGYPAAEAMACGTPVIVSDSTSLDEITGAAAVKVPSYDVDAAANALRALATNPDLRAQLSENCRNQASKYTWERSVESVDSAIRTVITCA